MATGVFAVGTLGYLLVRTDLFHTAPLAVLVAVLAAWALDARPRGLAAIPALVAGAALLFAVAEGLDRRWLVLRADTVALHLPAADGVRVPPREAAELAPAVRAVRRGRPTGPADLCRDAPRRPRNRRHTRCFYVLADRPNPTRYDIAAPGRRHHGAGAA